VKRIYAELLYSITGLEIELVLSYLGTSSVGFSDGGKSEVISYEIEATEVASNFASGLVAALGLHPCRALSSDQACSV
jgi:hypothetical protein